MELNFKVIGEGKPIVILHGLFGMLDNWQTFGKRLSEHGYQVFLVDQRDHGKSPWTDRFDLDVLADDLHEFLHQHNIVKPILIGHSMGGKVVMTFTRKYEELVDKLIVIDIGPRAYKRGHDDIFKALDDLNFDEIDDRDELYQAFDKNLDDEVVIQFLLKNVSRKDDGVGFELKFNKALIQPSYENILVEISPEHPIMTETLFVRGGKSRYVQDADLLDILEKFPMAKIETVLGAGHWVHAEQPDQLLEYILDFIVPLQ